MPSRQKSGWLMMTCTPIHLARVVDWTCSLRWNRQMQALSVYEIANWNCMWLGIASSACCHLLCEAENQEATGKIEESDMLLLCNFNLRSYTNIRSQPRKMCDKWIMLGDIAGVGAWYKWYAFYKLQFWQFMWSSNSVILYCTMH